MEIVEVNTRALLKKFLNFPRTLYFDILKSDKFIMPLELVSKITIGSLKAKKKKLFLAIENGEILGRIAYKVHSNQGETKLNIGFFECVPDREDVANKLFTHVHAQQPHLDVIGPYNFRMEDPYMGVLIKGHDHDPYFMMGYNPLYYKDYFESAGFTGSMDVLTYDVDSTKPLPQEMRDRADQTQAAGFSLRTMNKRKMKQEVKVIAKIFNDALSENWGFEELIDEQISEMYLMFKFFINPELVLFATKDGEDVGCLILLPNFNPYIEKSNGKLTPSLLWNILTKKNKIDSARGYALGIKKDFHGQGLGNFLVCKGWELGSGKAGIKKGEVSWILSDNEGMNHLTLKMDGKPNKAYRIYTKAAIQ